MQFPPSNLPTEQQRWGRAVEKSVNDLEAQARQTKNGVNNAASSSNGKQIRIAQQIADLREQAVLIQQQQEALAQQQQALQNTINYQASLITNSASATGTWNSGDIPGDQVQRWYPSGVKTTLAVATGRVLMGYGSSQVTVQAGNSSIVAYLRVHVTSSRGTIDTYIGNGLRIFLSGGYFGFPMYAERTVENLPVDESITFELEYGHWSAGTNPTGNMQFGTPFIRAQVIPA